jgi:hypothetical protein
VLSIRPDRGALTIRLTRFTIQVPFSDNGHAPATEGAIVGLGVAAQDVHVLDAAS